MLSPAGKPMRRKINLCFTAGFETSNIVATENSFSHTLIKKSEFAQKGTFVNFFREQSKCDAFSTSCFFLDRHTSVHLMQSNPLINRHLLQAVALTAFCVTVRFFGLR